jgi:hypothetical protein
VYVDPKVKDCALTQMGAFVDGEEGPFKGIDLGLSVGVRRGFEMREKVSFSGGMSVVEMCGEGELGARKTLALTVMTLLPTPCRAKFVAAPSFKIESWELELRLTGNSSS